VSSRLDYLLGGDLLGSDRRSLTIQRERGFIAEKRRGCEGCGGKTARLPLGEGGAEVPERISERIVTSRGGKRARVLRKKELRGARRLRS